MTRPTATRPTASARAHTLRRAPLRGQIIIIFGLSMALFLLGLVGLVVDLSYIFTFSTRAQAAAQVAAQAGANTIDSASIYAGNGVIRVDQTNFAAACQKATRSYLPTFADLAVDVQCATTPPGSNTVTATVTAVVRLPLALFGATSTVSGRFQAAPVVGSSCPAPPPPAKATPCPLPTPPGGGP